MIVTISPSITYIKPAKTENIKIIDIKELEKIMNLPILLSQDIFSMINQIVDDNVKGTEKNYPESIGYHKKEIAVKLSIEAYKQLDKALNLPDIVDTIVIALIPVLIDGAVLLYNKLEIFEHKPF